MVFGSEKRELKRQFNQQMMAQAEANDSEVAMSMSNPNNIAYDPQVSAVILEVRRRMLKWHVEKKQLPNGEMDYYFVCDETYPYKEPYGDESLSFMNEDIERKLLNQFGATISSVKMFADKYDLDWSYAFNDLVNKRTDFLLNSRTTGKPPRLAKSQFVESTAEIKRSMMTPRKKNFLDKIGGVFG